MVALRYAHDSTVVLRSASKFFFAQKGDPDRALSVLARSKQLRANPWLISAHVAIESTKGASPTLLGIAAKMVRDASLSGVNNSELLAAVATQEVCNGAYKRAAKLSRLATGSMMTENALAQFAWLESISGRKFDVTTSISNVSDAYEARARVKFSLGEWQDCMEEIQGWVHYQPFSERAAIMGSHVGLTHLQNPERTIEITEFGLKSNHSSFTLTNNVAVAYALMDKLNEARSILGRAPPPVDERQLLVREATNGLIQYRMGNKDVARQMYQRSFESAISLKQDGAVALNRLFLAREEFRAGEYLKSRHVLQSLLQQRIALPADLKEAFRRSFDSHSSGFIGNRSEELSEIQKDVLSICGNAR